MNEPWRRAAALQVLTEREATKIVMHKALIEQDTDGKSRVSKRVARRQERRRGREKTRHAGKGTRSAAARPAGRQGTSGGSARPKSRDSAQRNTRGREEEQGQEAARTRRKKHGEGKKRGQIEQYQSEAHPRSDAGIAPRVRKITNLINL